MAHEIVGRLTITHGFIWTIPHFWDIWTCPNIFFKDSPEFSIEQGLTFYFRLMRENADSNYPLILITKGYYTGLMARIKWLNANNEVYKSHTVHCLGPCYLVPDLITVDDIVLHPEDLLPGGVLSIEIELMKETSPGASMKFEPPIGIDYTMKNGTRVMVQTRHQCISEDKSFEELRYEHYRLTRSPSVWSTANTTTQQRIPSALNPSPVFPSTTITNEIAFPNPSSIASCVNFSEAYANRLSNPATSAFTFSNPTFNSTTAGTPMFSTSNHNSTLTFQRRANTTSFPSLRSTATAFNFTSATAYGNRLSNPATSAFTFSNPTLNSTNAAVGFGTHSPDVFTYPNSTTESRCYQDGSWNRQSSFSPSTSLPQCTICTDKERDIVFEPCGHLITCSTCVNQIGVFCPICRKVIGKIRKVYIS